MRLPRKAQPKSDFERILIISNTGVGDTMWGTPALKQLRKTHPKSYICILASALSSQVFQNNPDYDEMVTIKQGGGLPYFLKFFHFYRKKFDAVIVFHSSYKWTIPFAYFLGPKHLLAFKHDAKDFDFLTTELFEAKLNHPIIQRLMLVKKLGVTEDLYEMDFHTSKEEEKQAKAFLASHNIDPKKPLIGFQPGASEVFKCWPLDHFAQLAQKLYRDLDAQIVVFGNKKEIEMAKAIEKKAPIIMAAGQLSLRISAAVLKQMDVFITNDTGPLHLALAYGMPIVTIFGPTPSHLCWPHIKSPHVKILSWPLPPCYKCVSRKCLLPFCMEHFKVEEVYAYTCQLMEQYTKQKHSLIKKLEKISDFNAADSLPSADEC